MIGWLLTLGYLGMFLLVGGVQARRCWDDHRDEFGAIFVGFWAGLFWPALVVGWAVMDALRLLWLGRRP